MGIIQQTFHLIAKYKISLKIRNKQRPVVTYVIRLSSKILILYKTSFNIKKRQGTQQKMEGLIVGVRGVRSSTRSRPLESTKQGSHGLTEAEATISLHGSLLGPLHTCDGCVAWCSCGSANGGRRGLSLAPLHFSSSGLTAPLTPSSILCCVQANPVPGRFFCRKK